MSPLIPFKDLHYRLTGPSFFSMAPIHINFEWVSASKKRDFFWPKLSKTRFGFDFFHKTIAVPLTPRHINFEVVDAPENAIFLPKLSKTRFLV